MTYTNHVYVFRKAQNRVHSTVHTPCMTLHTNSHSTHTAHTGWRTSRTTKVSTHRCWPSAPRERPRSRDTLFLLCSSYILSKRRDRLARLLACIRLSPTIPPIQLPPNILFTIFYYLPPKDSSLYNSFSPTIPPISIPSIYYHSLTNYLFIIFEF